jgi:hypothetical protein
MQHVLKSTFDENKKCIQCTSPVNPKYISSIYLLIEPVQYGKSKIQFDLSIVFKDIPTKISLFDK